MSSGYGITKGLRGGVSVSTINHPPHYNNHPAGIECIDVTEEFNFNLGNAIKYIWRAGLKGNEIEDLEKAVWYVNREIARIKARAKHG